MKKAFLGAVLAGAIITTLSPLGVFLIAKALENKVKGRQ